MRVSGWRTEKVVDCFEWCMESIRSAVGSRKPSVRNVPVAQVALASTDEGIDPLDEYDFERIQFTLENAF